MMAAFWAGSAMAADCTAPDPATAEAIICGDSALQAEDAKLSEIFEATVAVSPELDRQLLRDNEVIFFDQRTLNCLDAPPPPDMLETVRACVRERTIQRQDYLNGVPEAGPGATGRLVPWVKQGADGSWIWMVHFAQPETPAEVLFNARVDDIVGKVHLAQTTDDYADFLSMTVLYAGPKLISANVDLVDWNPKLAHGMPANFQINIDMTTGKELTFADAFAPDAVDGLTKDCLADIAAYLADGHDSDGFAVPTEQVRFAVADLSQWRFGADAASLYFYDWASDTASSCSFPYAELRTQIRPGFPLP